MIRQRWLRIWSTTLSLFFLSFALSQPGEIVTVEGIGYAPYSDATHGYSLLVPTTVFLPQGVGKTGQAFFSEDGRASLIVYAQPNELGESLEQVYARERTPAADKSVTYDVLKDGWFVVSGYSGGNVYYQKTFVTDEALKTVRLEYPPDLKAELDPLTSEISWSFSSFGADEATFLEAELPAEEPKSAALELIPHTNGEQAEAPPGPTISRGETLLWAYIVTNTGEVNLADLSVGNDLGAQASCSTTRLAPGESTLCVADGVAQEGQQQFVNRAEAVTSEGNIIATEVPGFYSVEVNSQ